MIKNKNYKKKVIINEEDILCPYCGEDECATIYYLSNNKKIITSDCDPNSYKELEKQWKIEYTKSK